MKLLSIGQKFNRLTVIESAGLRPLRREALWLCLCECGRSKVFRTSHLTSGTVVSCGCYKTERIRILNRTHGDANKCAEYKAWKEMKDRCLNSKGSHFPRWGGRGITICQPWIRSYAQFLADVGRRPSPQHSLDRIKNDGNYEPGNVRWATAKMQANNRRERKKQ